MGTIQNGNFYSAYLGDQIDLLLGAMAQANPMPSGTDWVAFIDDCRAAQGAAEAAAGNAADSEADAEDAAQGAADSASAAAGSASAASASKTGADNAAILAESYAHGGTGTRTGEDTDNAKYYSEIAEQEADRAHRIAIEDYTAEDFPLSSTDDTTVAEAVAPLYAPTTVSGTIVTIDDGIEGASAQGLTVEVPYTADGVTSVKVTRTGKNLYKIESTYNVAYSSSGDYSSNYGVKSGDTLITKRGWQDKGVWWNSSYPIHLPVDTQLTVSAVCTSDNTSNYCRIGLATAYNQNRKWERHSVTTEVPVKLSHTDTFEGNANWYFVNQDPGSSSTSYRTNLRATDIQVEIGDTATDYEPYNGITSTITLPSNWYGGTIDLVAKTATLKYDAEGNELATPTVTDISVGDITLVGGVNNLWASVGDVTLTYRGDIANIYREIANLKTAILSLGGNV